MTSGAFEEASELQMIHGTRTVVGILSRKWSVEVLYLLAGGTRRYCEVLYEIGEVSKKALTNTLRTLERHGLVARRVYPEVPPRVEYSLTQLGWTFTEPLMAMSEWAAEHLPADPSAPPAVRSPR
jgi:DNA-binding HxlR family transcriptional regulator